MNARGHFPLVGGLAVTIALFVAGCGGDRGDTEAAAKAKTTELTGTGPISIATSSSGPYLEDQVERWNRDHPKEKVTIVELPANATETHSQLALNLQAKSDRMDVLMTATEWTPEFAARGWLQAIDPADVPNMESMFENIVAAGDYEGAHYGVPAFVDTGLLYYRTDLVDAPPETWDELIDACSIAEANDMGCYAGQFMEYGGLTVNFFEALQGAGGSLLNEDNTEATVDTPEGQQALGFLVDGFEEGYIPEVAITFDEEGGRRAFQEGKLLFLRNWSYVYNLANTPGKDSKVAGKFDVGRLPGPTGPMPSKLGGWMYNISAFSDAQLTAARFIQFLSSPEEQAFALKEAGIPPVTESLYEDPELIEIAPYLPGLYENLRTANDLPSLPQWNEVDKAIHTNVYAALNGKLSVDEALTKMQSEMNEALSKG